MNKSIILLASVAAIALGAPAFAATDDAGSVNSKSKVESTDAAGTTTTVKKSVEGKVDADGNGKKVIKTEETTDPKGLFNKSTVKTKDTVKAKDGETTASHKKTVDGKTTESTTDTTTSK